jgi:hypothetical protein
MLKLNAVKLSAIVIGSCIFGLAVAPAQAENAPTPVAPAVTIQTISTIESATTATPVPGQLVSQKLAPQPIKAKPKFQRETLNCRIFAAETMQQ